MIETISRKIIKPCNCLLAISLPLTKKDFYNDLENKINSYVKSRDAKYPGLKKEDLWTIDHLSFIKLYEETKRELIFCGLTIKENFKISDLKMINEYDVTTFITHSIVEKKQIEFYDGLFFDYEFVKNMPDDFCKIIDLTNCNSNFLQDPIKIKYKECITIAHEHPVNLDFNLIFYKNLMKLLHKRDLNYIDAFTKLRISLLQK
jgi:hypothetical protein